MRKRPYRSISVKTVDFAKLAEKVSGEDIVLGIDVAKEKFFASVLDRHHNGYLTVHWTHPLETLDFIKFVEMLRSVARSVEVAMEPSGVYGDPIRFMLIVRGFSVFRVSPKRSHDAMEVFDGVPSLHDAKCAGIVGKLHIDGASECWPIKADTERTLSAAVRVLNVYERQFQQHRGRLEGLTACYWPEVTGILGLGTSTLLELLLTYGSPAAVAANHQAACKLMEEVGGSALDLQKVKDVLHCAHTTIGMPPIAEEVELIKVVAAEAQRSRKAALAARRRIEHLGEELESTKNMSPLVGKVTAAVIVVGTGDLRRYDSPSALVKAVGLNLKEISSGKSKGGLHITKRGSGLVRKYLFLAALRLIRQDDVVRAWYCKKVERQGGKYKSKAVVAVMRKLLLALWYVAKGEPFDAHKLFDVNRLEIRCAGKPSRRPRGQTPADVIPAMPTLPASSLEEVYMT